MRHDFRRLLHGAGHHPACPRPGSPRSLQGSPFDERRRRDEPGGERSAVSPQGRRSRCRFGVLCYGVDGVNVFFGSDVAVAPAEARARAERIYEASPFPFPFCELVAELRPVARHAGARERVPLSDATDRSKSTAGLPPSDPIFYGAKRNDACPCGSGQKFKKCHGR